MNSKYPHLELVIEKDAGNTAYMYKKYNKVLFNFKYNFIDCMTPAQKCSITEFYDAYFDNHYFDFKFEYWFEKSLHEYSMWLNEEEYKNIIIIIENCLENREGWNGCDDAFTYRALKISDREFVKKLYHFYLTKKIKDLGVAECES